MSTLRYRVRSGEDLGRVVRDARAAHRLTQQQLVDRLELGFDRTRLARIESGAGFQSLDRVLSVLRRLGVEVYATVPEPARRDGQAHPQLNDRADADDHDDDDDDDDEAEKEDEREAVDPEYHLRQRDGGG